MATGENPASPGTFLTAVQPAPFDDYVTDDIGELEALVAGVTQTPFVQQRFRYRFGVLGAASTQKHHRLCWSQASAAVEDFNVEIDSTGIR